MLSQLATLRPDPVIHRFSECLRTANFDSHIRAQSDPTLGWADVLPAPNLEGDSHQAIHHVIASHTGKLAVASRTIELPIQDWLWIMILGVEQGQNLIREMLNRL